MPEHPRHLQHKHYYRLVIDSPLLAAQASSIDQLLAKHPHSRELRGLRQLLQKVNIGRKCPQIRAMSWPTITDQNAP